MPQVARTSFFVSLALVTAGALLGCPKKEPAPEKPAGLPATGAPPPAATEPAPTPAAEATPPAPEPEAVPAAPDPSQTVSGTITLPKAHRKKVSSADVVFIIARKAGGPPGPGSMLAVQKHPASDFPLAFTLSDRDAMIPGTPFAGEVNIMVRLDKDGDAITRKKGDLVGEANGVKVGAQDVAIPLDTVLKEDVNLGGGPPPRGMMPPGHP